MSGADGDDVKLHMLAEDQQDGKFIIKKESHTLNMLGFFFIHFVRFGNFSALMYAGLHLDKC